MKIIDDFLSEEDLKRLQDVMLSPDFPWYYNSTIDYKDEKGKFQFIHAIYRWNRPLSNFYGDWYEKLIKPVIGDNTIIERIKANLLTKTTHIVENEFHVDDPTKKLSTSAIFYLNSNNGYTKFKDGTKVKSIENRLVKFPVAKEHTGTSCTDENVRVVINFHYIEL